MIYTVINKVRAATADGSFILPMVMNPFNTKVKVAMCPWSPIPYAVRSVSLGVLQKGDWIDAYAAEEITNETMKQNLKILKACWSPGQLIVAATSNAIVGEEITPKSIGKNSTPEGTFGMHHLDIRANGSNQVQNSYSNGAFLIMLVTIWDTSPPPNAPMFFTGDGHIGATVTRPSV